MTEQTASYSIEIKDEANEQLAIFTFTDATADELQTVLADLRRVLGELSGTLVSSTRWRRRGSLASYRRPTTVKAIAHEATRRVSPGLIHPGGRGVILRQGQPLMRRQEKEPASTPE